MNKNSEGLNIRVSEGVVRGEEGWIGGGAMGGGGPWAHGERGWGSMDS
jgi:hypothetical protein